MLTNYEEELSKLDREVVWKKIDDTSSLKEN